MKVCAVFFVAFVAAVSAGVIPAVIPATTLIRTPAHDSAVIQSDRLGGNFAWSSVEGHAYAAVSPVVQNVISPVGISYSATPIHTPVNVLHHQIIHPYYTQGAILTGAPILAGAPVINPVIPGVVAPAIPIDPTQNLTPIAAEVPQEGEAPIAAAPAPEAPVEAAPEAPAPQADEGVSVEAV